MEQKKEKKHGNLKREKKEIIAQYARHKGDTGSVEVQVACPYLGNQPP